LEITKLMTEQLKGQLAEVEKLRAEAAESKLRVVQVESDMKLQMQEAKSKMLERQLLHSRLEALHTANLLEEMEFFGLEDVITDAAAEAAVDDDDRVSQMVALSARLTGDAAFVRQLRRKFL
jgi:hypothetical protein